MTRTKICARDINAGPGTCKYWWEGCPEKASHCFSRFVTSNGGSIDLVKAQEWERARDIAVDPAPVLL